MNLSQQLRSKVDQAQSGGWVSQWMSIEELAARMGVSVRTIRRLHASDGGPQRTKRSRRFMYLRADVEEWLFCRSEKP